MTTETELDVTTFAQAVEAVRGGADPDQMAAALLRQMTEAERLTLLDGDEPFWPGMPDMMGDRLQPRAHHRRRSRPARACPASGSATARAAR